MYITYLGTAAAEGVPAIFCECEFCRYAAAAGGKEVRMRSGALIDGKLKIDFGPDSFIQSVVHRQSYIPVEHLLITHSHPDHFFPDDIDRVRPGFSRRTAPLTVYGNERVEEGMHRLMGNKNLRFVRLEAFKTYHIDEYDVTPLDAVHAIGSGEKPLFYLIEKDGRRLLYAHDTDIFTDADFEFLRGKRLDLVSMDCTNGILTPRYIGHMDIRKNLELRARLIENGSADENTIFVASHFSHNGLRPHEEMEQRLPGFIVAYDGLTLMI